MRLMMLLALAACGDKDGTDTGATTTDDTAAADTGSGEICEAVAWIDGNSGTFTVDSSAEEDIKHHWRMGEDITRIEATVTWDQPDWRMELQIGIGTCPDSGTAYATEADDGGSVTIDLLPADVNGGDTFTPEEKWFAHFARGEAGLEEGATTDFTMEVLACKAAR